VYQIRAIVSRWIADPEVDAVITTGGTGVTGRDGTPEAVRPLLDKVIEGFGETFRAVSWQQIKTSTLQSRALAGAANATYLFCVPGSSGACATAWDEIIEAQLDFRTRPCNLVELMPRLLEK
jgi:molybdenum cofactor biosynthesis protein B